MQNFITSANSRETSTEIMSAISNIARSESDAVRIWEEPCQSEMIAVWERVTKNGLIDASEFCWGASGSDWAKAIEA